MHRTFAIVIVLALGLWLAAPSLASAQEPTPAPTSPGIESSSSSGSLRDLNATSIAAGVGVILLALLGGGGIASLILARRQVTREGKQEKRESTQDIWDSYETRIRLADERGDKDTADKVRLEYEQQQVAWQAQQGIEQITPIEISAAKDEPSLAPEEIKQLRDLLSQSKGLAPAFLSSKVSLLRGNAHYRAGQYEQALAAYDRALKLRADDPEILASRGLTFGQLARYEDALGDLKRSLELRPDHATTIYNRGLTFDYLNRHEDALADYNRALEIRPDDAATLMNRGSALTGLERYDNALADYDRSLELRPDHTMTLMNRGITLHHLGQHADAVASYTRAIELEPRDVLALLNRASLHAEMGNAIAAGEDLRGALDQGDLAGFRRQSAREAATHAYFEPLRADPALRKLFEEIVGPQPPSK